MLDRQKMEDSNYRSWISQNLMGPILTGHHSQTYSTEQYIPVWLTDSQQLFYLEGLLTGEASRLLTYVTVTDANYEDARGMSQKRYGYDMIKEELL